MVIKRGVGTLRQQHEPQRPILKPNPSPTGRNQSAMLPSFSPWEPMEDIPHGRRGGCLRDATLRPDP